MNKLERLIMVRTGPKTSSEDGRDGTRPSRCSGIPAHFNPWKDGFHAVRCFFSGLGMAGWVSLIFLTGCLSTHPGSESLAYIDLETEDVKAIRVEALRVLEDENYSLVREVDNQLVFERPATQRDRMMYGRFIDEEGLVMRIEMKLEPRRKGGTLIRADAFAVHAGFTEKVPFMGRRPYRNLLGRIKASLVQASREE